MKIGKVEKQKRGTIAEEASILAGIAAAAQAYAAREVAGLPHPVPEDYFIENTSECVVNALGTAMLSNQWNGNGNRVNQLNA